MMSKPFNHQRLYDRLAPLYAPAMRLFPVWLRYAQQALPWLPSSGAILEIGPGPGVLLSQIARHYPRAAGIDLSMRMLQHARRRLRHAALPVCLVQGNAVQLPFASSSFDGIVTTFAFSAIPDGLAAMYEMRRVLRSGGTLALVDACVPGDGNRIGRGLARLWERFGDTLRDEAVILRKAELNVIERREFGAFNSIRLTVARKA